MLRSHIRIKPACLVTTGCRWGQFSLQWGRWSFYIHPSSPFHPCQSTHLRHMLRWCASVCLQEYVSVEYVQLVLKSPTGHVHRYFCPRHFPQTNPPKIIPDKSPRMYPRKFIRTFFPHIPPDNKPRCQLSITAHDCLLCMFLNFWSPAKRRGHVAYNFGRVCLYVCLSDDNFQMPWCWKFIFAHRAYLHTLWIKIVFKGHWHWVKDL